MILHTLPPAFGQRNLSPFCLKAEMALRHLDLAFTHRPSPPPRYPRSRTSRRTCEPTSSGSSQRPASTVANAR